MHSLQIKNNAGSETIMLDDFKLQCVSEYKIVSSANKEIELTIKITVSTNEISLK